MADDDTKELQARLSEIETRLRVLADADDNASWGRPSASRGGFRQEQVHLIGEAERIRSQLKEGTTGA